MYWLGGAGCRLLVEFVGASKVDNPLAVELESVRVLCVLSGEMDWILSSEGARSSGSLVEGSSFGGEFDGPITQLTEPPSTLSTLSTVLTLS